MSPERAIPVRTKDPDVRRARTRVCATMVTTVALLAFPAIAGATDVTFDDLAPGTVVNEYPAGNPEISFGSPISFGFTSGPAPADGVVSHQVCHGGAPTVTASTPTSSPPNMGQFANCGIEFGYHSTFAILTNFANSVSAYVGDPTPSGTGSTFHLDAYDINRHLLGSSTITTTQTGPTNPISFAAPGGAFNIAYFALYADLESDHFEIGMDDLSFNPCTPGDTCFPEISLSSSAGGQLSQGASVQYRVSLFRHNGSNGDVALSASGLPSGINATFNPSTLTGTATASTMAVSVDDNAPIGGATGTITATPSSGAGSVTRTAPVSFSVVAPFGVYVGQDQRTQPSQSSISLPPCSSATEQIETRLGPSFTGSPIDLAVSSLGDTSDVSSISLPKTSLDNPSDFDASGENRQELTVTRNANQTAASSFDIQISPTSGGSFTEPTATVTVNRTTARVDSVSPRSVATPQALRPGSEVTIKGAGFCPGSTVAFGNPSAVATPDSISPDGTQIRVKTPALATDGPVTVKNGVKDVSSSASLTVDSYRNVNGYQFKNFPPHIVFSQLTDAFGADQTYDSVNLCLIGCKVSIRDPFALILNAIANQYLTGDCFGFSLSSQRFLERQRSLSDFPPGNASSIFGLDGPSGPPGQLTQYLNAMQVSQLSIEFLSHWLFDVSTHVIAGGARSSQAVFNEIKQTLSQGRFPLIALRNGGDGHVVIAYNLEGSPPNWYADVYDSNDPFNFKGNESNTSNGSVHQQQFESSRIQVGADGNWTLPSTNNMSGHMSDFVVTDPASLPNRPTIVSSLAKIAKLGYVLFGSAGSPDTTGTGAAGPSPSIVTQVTDAAGHTLFDSYGKLNNDSKTRLAGAPFAPLVGRSARSAAAPGAIPPMILLPPSATNFQQTITDTGNGADTHTILGHGFGALVGTSAVRGSVDKLKLSPNGAGFATNAARKPLSLTLVAAAGSSRRVAGVSTTSFNGAGDTLSFTGGRRGLAFVHRGAGTTFRITLSGLDSRHVPQLFESGRLHIGRGGTALIGGIQWGSLQGSQIRLRLGGRTLVVRNRFHVAQLAAISSLHAQLLHKRAVALRITAARRILPAGALIAYTWIVRRDGRTISSHSVVGRVGVRSASFTFHAERTGSYVLTAAVTVVTIRGVAQSTSRATRTLRFHA
jgi:hypothetical protein